MIIVPNKHFRFAFILLLFGMLTALAGAWITQQISMAGAFSNHLAPIHFGTISELARNSAVVVGAMLLMLGTMFLLSEKREHNGTTILDERAVAVAAVVLWYVAFALFVDVKYGDENANQNAIEGIFNGDWTPTQRLAVIPGYHWLVAQLSAFQGPSLFFSRTLTMVVSLLMLFIFYKTASIWKPAQAAHATLGLALLPIILPYTATAYTDVPSLALTLGAFWALTNKRYNASAVLLLAACYVRQSNLVWMGLFAVIGAWHIWQSLVSDKERPKPKLIVFLLRDAIGKLYGYIVAGLVFLGSLVLLSGDLIYGNVPANSPRPNPGNLFAAAFYALLFWAPIWLPSVREDVRALLDVVRTRFGVALGAFVVLVLIAFGLFFGYDNFHPWNQPYNFITNIPLVLMEDSAALRLAGILILYWTAWVLARCWAYQPHRVEIALVLVFFIIFMLPHALVDPRYYFVAFALIHLFWIYPEQRLGALLVWWAVISSGISSAMIVASLRYTTISW